MRKETLTSVLLVVLSYTATAQQLTLLPQVGFENSRTTINYNDLGSFAPLGGEFSPQVALRLDYKFKQGFGPYLGVSTSRSTVAYSFSDLETGMNSYTASAGAMQIRFEGGYQFTTKPLKLGKSKSAATNNSSEYAKSKSRCGYKTYSSRCSGYSERMKQGTTNKNSTWVKLQPSVGIGYIPSINQDVVVNESAGQKSYEYLAGNWNTAFITGMGFEFGRNNQRLFNVSINYFNGFGNLNEQTISEVSGSKTTAAQLQSDASGWNMRIGIPFTLTKNKNQAKTKSENKSTKQSGSCRQYKTTYKRTCIRF